MERELRTKTTLTTIALLLFLHPSLNLFASATEAAGEKGTVSIQQSTNETTISQISSAGGEYVSAQFGSGSGEYVSTPSGSGRDASDADDSTPEKAEDTVGSSFEKITENSRKAAGKNHLFNEFGVPDGWLSILLFSENILPLLVLALAVLTPTALGLFFLLRTIFSLILPSFAPSIPDNRKSIFLSPKPDEPSKQVLILSSLFNRLQSNYLTILRRNRITIGVSLLFLGVSAALLVLLLRTATSAENLTFPHVLSLTSPIVIFLAAAAFLLRQAFKAQEDMGQLRKEINNVHLLISAGMVSENESPALTEAILNSIDPEQSGSDSVKNTDLDISKTDLKILLQLVAASLKLSPH